MGKMKANQGGFTLVELVVVMVILGILAATALPRFINLTADARVAAVNGMAGAVRSTVALAQARFMADGATNAGNVDFNGTPVGVSATGIPTAAGIQAALVSTEGFAVAAAADGLTVTFTPNGAPATCVVTYTVASGAVASPDAEDCD